EGVGFVAVGGVAKEPRIVLEHGVEHSVELRFPLPGIASVVGCAGEQRIHAGFTVAPVLKQQVGDAAVRRHHEDAALGLLCAAAMQDNVVAHGGIVAHGCATDLFYGMHADLLFMCSGSHRRCSS